MENKTETHDLVIVGSDSGMTRWAPLVVVLGVVAGFVALSYYAYHAGIQSVKEEDLVVVEADKTPIKEKPTDPGGMQFPNQDKTVFETFSGNDKQPAKVERVLPEPEEPMQKETEASETTTWVNKELPKKGAPEQVIGKDTTKKPDSQHLPASITAPDEKATFSAEPTTEASDNHQVVAAQARGEDEQSETYVAPQKGAGNDNARPQPFAPEKAAVTTKNMVVAKAGNTGGEDSPTDDMAHEKPGTPAAKPVEKPASKPAPKAASEPKPAIIPAHTGSGGSMTVQLGAYRSQNEALDAWEKMHLKQKLLSDKKPIIIRADLGDKGIYYRLRVGGLASEAEAKAMCHALSSHGQPCIIPVDK